MAGQIGAAEAFMARNWRVMGIAAIAALIVFYTARKQVGKINDEVSVTMSLIGQPAPDFSLTDLGGRTVQLSSLKGKVVLLDFWATWCGPCKLSLPHIQKVADDGGLAKRGLQVFAVNEKDAKPLVQAFMNDNHFSFPVLLDTDGLMNEEYKLAGIPTTVVIGKDGKVKNAWIGYSDDSDDEVDQALDQALNAS